MIGSLASGLRCHNLIQRTAWTASPRCGPLQTPTNSRRRGQSVTPAPSGAEAFEGWLAYGAALNEGRALFPSNEEFGQWVIDVGLHQVGVNDIRLEDRVAAMWADGNLLSQLGTVGEAVRRLCQLDTNEGREDVASRARAQERGAGNQSGDKPFQASDKSGDNRLKTRLRLLVWRL